MRTQVVTLVLQARQSPTNASNGQDNEEARKNAHIPVFFQTRQVRIADQMEGIESTESTQSIEWREWTKSIKG